MDPILQGLNAAQYDAVTSPADVIQVLAPPGSGKTKTLTSRVAYLLRHHKYKPWNVICLTFTIKSSREMKERIAKLLGNGIEAKLILGTFHSVCRRYLVTYGHLIGIKKGFGIADSSDTISIMKRIIKRLGLTIDARKAQSRISSSKSRGISWAEIAQQQLKEKKKDIEQHEFVVVFEAYEDQLAKSNLLDYDDLLLRCVHLLRQHPTCVSNVEVVLIDEFQDTNLVQFDLMRLFAAKNRRVTTVGDPDQSIYGWRSAEIKNLKRMQKQYPDTLVIHLQDNYRSSGAILLAAQEVIEQDESRPSKFLQPTHCPGTTPVLRRLPSSEIEASWIVSEILRIIGLTGRLLTFSDFSILLRSAALSRQVESAMGKAGIPYRMVGGQRFFDRAEIKLVLDYLRVLSQPSNNDALARIINVPTRGIGVTTAKNLLEEAEMMKVTLWTHIRDAVLGRQSVRTKISKPAEQGLGSLTRIILTCRKNIVDEEKPQSPEDLVQYITKQLGLQNYLEKNYPNDHETRWANIEELFAQAAEYPVLHVENSLEEEGSDHLPSIEGLEQDKGPPGEEALSKFLANVALATELQRDDDDAEEAKTQPQVTISTIHAAKGLEWPVIFVPSTYEGSIPHSRAEDNDEERRLLYVAMTRAQALLYMSCPIKNSQREETKLSQFLSTKKVGRYLVSKGPAVSPNTVNDLSRILRRGCPTEAHILEASKNLQSYEDNLWPVNAEEDSKAIQARWSKWDEARGNEHVAKRRRVNDSERVEPLAEKTTCMLTTIGAATTMQNSSSFSYKGKSGFISAASQMQHTEKEKSTYASSSALLGASKRPPRANCHDKVGSQQEQQRNLVSLWGGEKHHVKNEESVALETLEEKDYQKAVRASMETLAQASNDRSYVAPREPLSALPQVLAAHRLPTTSSSTRPALTIDGDEPVKKQYDFLSSSPPPVESVPKALEVHVEDSHNCAMDGLKGNIKSTDVRPATTFHTTTVSQVSATSGAVRKTLGVRRSMNGWSTKTPRGFSVPRKSGPIPHGQ
ncbi:hypothetical protein JMJ35_000740 [Cladonia borealis]|uniref:DNA 3'-5' helicase n=1 Tax=Cladonia borealis TaxID=184061 RepID=A0AA39R758_9LECA|nr:hypothetical protein JMJ35_000740 [Cladonia borealis]